MAGIAGQVTTFNSPNYVGPLFQITPSDTPFLSSIGGLTGGRAADQKLFEWQTYDLRDVENPSHLEGQNAPDARGRARENVQNVVQIFHDTVDVSYTKRAAFGQRDGLPGNNPVGDELAWQVEQALKQLARDIEHVFLTGSYDVPSTNASPRKTRGILEAIDTNVTDLGGADLTEDDVLDLMQDVWTSGGIREDETRTIITNATIKRKLTKIFIKDAGYEESTRNVGGVNVQSIQTDFGNLNIMLNRYMPSDELAVVSLEACAPRFLLVPGKGFLFEEELAKIGASDRTQIYGEVGLEYGNERQHGKLLNVDNDE